MTLNDMVRLWIEVDQRERELAYQRALDRAVFAQVKPLPKPEDFGVLEDD